MSVTMINNMTDAINGTVQTPHGELNIELYATEHYYHASRYVNFIRISMNGEPSQGMWIDGNKAFLEQHVGYIQKRCYEMWLSYNGTPMTEGRADINNPDTWQIM